MALRTYAELLRLPTFEERFQYVSFSGDVGEVTFGGRRMLNQRFYRSPEWKQTRDAIIVRDSGCDLASLDHPICGKVIIHHLNPITVDEIDNVDMLLNPEFLVCVSYETHNALHYGNEETLLKEYKPRFQHDTCPWRW